jgi:16S rRNA (cytosine1402-N4)-methyltransferase
MHIPVLLNNVLNHATPQSGENVIDCTFGRGGYSRAFLQAGCHVTAFDTDATAQESADILSTDYPQHFKFIHSQFSKIADFCPPQSADIIVFDIGVSSPQLDNSERGFSFLRDGPLDMRMGNTKKTAADLVNNLSEKDLADLISKHSSHYTKTGRKKNHPATLIFQALRIAVNDELNEFQTALSQCKDILKPNGRLVMVTFHSLEDRIAKHYCKTYSFTEKTSKYAAVKPTPQNYYTLLTKKSETASDDEIKNNPRASCAKLRAVMRTDYNEPLQE